MGLRSGSVGSIEAPVVSRRPALLVGGVAGIALVLIVTITVALAVSSYLHGGGRLTVAGGRADGPVRVGDEFHFIVPIAANGTVQLRSAAVKSEEGGATVTTRLVRLHSGAAPGTLTGPLGSNYEVVTLEGRRVSDDDGDRSYALDISVVADHPGVHHLSAVRVTYESGRFRRRTSTAASPGCVDVRTDVTAGPSGC